MLLFSSLWIHIDIDSLWPHIMGLYLLMVSYLAQSLCKCRCAPNIAAVLLKNPRIFRPCSRSVNPAAFTWTRCCDWSQISLRVQSNHLAFSSDFSPIAPGTVRPFRKWLRIVTVTMLMDRRQTTAVYSTAQKHSSGLITTDIGRDLLFNDLVCDKVQYVLRLGKIASGFVSGNV